MTSQAARAVLVAGILFALAGGGFGLYGWLTLGRGRPAVAGASAPTTAADALQAALDA